MQNRNWFYFEVSVESSSFIFNSFKTEKFKLSFEGWNRPVCHLFGFTRVSSVKICCISPSNSEANGDGAVAEFLFPLFFSFSASFKHSSPREKVGKLSSFWDWWLESLFLSIMVAKYLNIFPHANNDCSCEKKTFLAKRFAPAISAHSRDLEHAYVYWIWLRGSASYFLIWFYMSPNELLRRKNSIWIKCNLF